MTKQKYAGDEGWMIDTTLVTFKDGQFKVDAN